MSDTDVVGSGAVHAPIVPTFFRYVIPSVLSLLAISTASLVDGFFVGNFVGAEALAAVNILMPYTTLLFGLALMFAVGGSIKAGIYIGRGENLGASQLFSKTIILIFTVTVAAIPVSLIFSEQLYIALGATPDMYAWIDDYFGILVYVMVVQLCTLVLYYFVRADDFPELGMQALLLGAATNIALDALFIYVFGWGIEGAAYATLFAQCLQLLVIARYFLVKERRLQFMLRGAGWRDLPRAAFNGFSEFVNEISVGIVVLVLHWIIAKESGVEGIAAFSVINYLIFISLMTYYGIVDAMHGLLGQNFGAGKIERVHQFMVMSTVAIAGLSICVVVILHVFQDAIVDFFLDDTAITARDLTREYVVFMWPLFLFNGINVLVCAYLTAAEKAVHSAILALLRSLILPVGFAVTLYFYLEGNAFVYSIPLAEVITFALALVFAYQFRPKNLTPPEGGQAQV